MHHCFVCKNILIQNQPLLREIYKDPPVISYSKGKWLEDMLVKAKTIKACINTMGTRESVIARVYFSQTSVTFAGDLAAVRNSEVSARRELTAVAVNL